MHNSVNFADPVRPRGHLVSTVAELALHVINDLRRGAVKRVLPLRFAVKGGLGVLFAANLVMNS